MKKQKCNTCKQSMELLTGTKNRSGVYHWAWVCRKCDDLMRDEVSCYHCWDAGYCGDEGIDNNDIIELPCDACDWWEKECPRCDDILHSPTWVGEDDISTPCGMCSRRRNRRHENITLDEQAVESYRVNKGE